MFLLMFPGQGAQKMGMGLTLYEAFPEAKSVFDEVDDALSIHLSRLIFQGDISELNLTLNTQPAIMAVSIAIIRVLESGGLSLTSHVKAVAGHSLGEYSALTAAHAISLSDAARLLRLRGQAMQESIAPGVGAMAAILGVSLETLEEVCAQAAQGQICAIANDNCEGQVVISGHATAIARAIARAQDRGAKRAVALPISVPCHCILMQPAQAQVAQALESIILRAPQVPILTNVSAQVQKDPDVLRAHLIEQVTGQVRWRETLAQVEPAQTRALVEVGPGTVLAGLAKRIQPDIMRISLETPQEIEAFLHTL